MEALCIAQWEPCDATLMPVFNEQENSTHEDLPILYPDELLLDYETLHKTPLPNDRELELEALVQKQNNEICELNQRINLLLKNTLQPPERVWVVLKIANVNRAMSGFSCLFELFPFANNQLSQHSSCRSTFASSLFSHFHFFPFIFVSSRRGARSAQQARSNGLRTRHLAPPSKAAARGRRAGCGAGAVQAPRKFGRVCARRRLSRRKASSAAR